MTEQAKNLLKEPLLHFLLLGAAIFVGFEIASRLAAEKPDEILVSQARIEALGEKFARTWQRSPDVAEMNGLIQDFVRDEVAVREAAAMGIDRDDTAIRRLLRQRVEFVAEEVVLLAEPDDAALLAFLELQADVFRRDTLVSFSHVFLDPRRRASSLEADAAQLLVRLNAAGGQISDADLYALGDTTLLERQFTETSIDTVTQVFGAEFASALSSLALGQWSAPIASAYGQHLVKVDNLVPGAVPALVEVRDAVRREWVNAQRIEVLDQFYAELLQRYRVKVDMPQSWQQVPARGDELAEQR